ncbi:NADH-quinone oxidoreductase subunit L [Roseimicrobium gellanilyticum]|uniref:NADH-quinone oxidoreductase subunit L n=1 Tax=Roseimicrobium gellanilyticum TaxID=748857 RepID=A0A366H5E0_9BACT|nr:NADH-quinone oxidoreductase subunit L [Roseimicrobium gellanilyticum]RBP36400.1 NADH-quinone oxidoreductase subunit L [Roseimicrobium gellanilyticum]
MNFSPETLTGMVLLLPLASAVVITLLHGVLKNTAHLISTGVAVIMFLCALVFLGAKDQDRLLMYPFLQVGDFKANISFIVDQQSKGMLFIVTFIGMLVHIYSTSYMKDDAAKARYFAALSLFMFSMNGIVLADNLVMMFLFWELVGVSSYLLIGHWFTKPEASDAAKKAFITNRVGDFGFMAGILILFGATGNLTEGVLSFSEMKDAMASSGSLLKDFVKHQPELFTIACLGLFLGAVGKSAQAPLHVWLPDAMEGPTPVSALIHAATMVAAGVYMLVRVYFLLYASPVALEVISYIGGITALMAALMATQQNDIKKVLAYSTLSQLGYMVMAVGLMAPNEGMFHLYTHAFFKALLFLGAGAVIHSCHHEQDIWKMGGLAKKMPVTFYTFVIGTAALMGVPYITSGFWSKEGILIAAYPHEGHGNLLLFIMGVATAFLTAFYMTRLVVVVFLGKSRTKHADHAHESPLVMILPLAILAIPSLISTWIAGTLSAMVPEEHHNNVVLILSVAVLIAGYLVAVKIYKGKDKDPLNIPIFANKFYWDEFYAGLVKYGQDRLAWIINGIESIVVDGLTVRLPAALAKSSGNVLRRIQSGGLQAYTFVLGLGIVIAVYLAVYASSKN